MFLLEYIELIQGTSLMVQRLEMVHHVSLINGAGQKWNISEKNKKLWHFIENQTRLYKTQTTSHGHEVPFRVPLKKKWPSSSSIVPYVCCFSNDLRNMGKFFGNHHGDPRISKDMICRFQPGPTIYQQGGNFTSLENPGPKYLNKLMKNLMVNQGLKSRV